MASAGLRRTPPALWAGAIALLILFTTLAALWMRKQWTAAVPERSAATESTPHPDETPATKIPNTEPIPPEPKPERPRKRDVPVVKPPERERKPPAPPPPLLIEFSARPQTVAPGEAAVLKWNVSGARSVRLMPAGDAVGLTGTRQVTPARDESYTLIAENAEGKIAERAVKVTVLGPLKIESFRAEPDTVPLDGEASLSWSLSRPADIRIEMTERPAGSRAVFVFNARGTSGSTRVFFDKGTFTRYGAHQFRITVKDRNELQESLARITMRQSR